ncbi:MAG: hypothetical protein ACJ73J_11045 [Actinomycetes bacterium]
MGNRAVLLVAVGSFSLALLAGCNDETAPDPNAAAFKGPSSTDLTVAADTSCTGNGAISYGDTVEVSGSNYLPDSVVDLRWTDLNTNDTSALDSVTADKHGDFTTTFTVVRPMGRVGDRLLVDSHGSSESGILVLQAKLNLANC